MDSPLSDYPLVSVALCTFNGARFLREQLDSLSAQDYPYLEFVVCDDASTDETSAVLRAWDEPRARLFFNETRLGYNQNFIQCFARCQGEFVAPCDQDDRWKPAKISRLHAALDGADLAYCDSRYIDETGADLGHSVSDGCRMLSGRDPLNLVSGNYVSGHASLFRRSLLQVANPFPKHPPSSLIYDWWLAFVAADRQGLRYVDETLVDFRRHSSAATVARETGEAASNKLKRHRARVAQLRQFADRSSGDHRAALARYAELMARRERQWLSPALSAFVAANGQRLYARDLNPARTIRSRAFDLLIGLKLRRLFSPAAFSEPA